MGKQSTENSIDTSEDVLRTAADELEPPVSGMIARGLEVLRTQLKTMPNSPGVYRMLNKRGDALYIGKARNLKKRDSRRSEERRVGQEGGSHGKYRWAPYNKKKKNRLIKTDQM